MLLGRLVFAWDVSQTPASSDKLHRAQSPCPSFTCHSRKRQPAARHWQSQQHSIHALWSSAPRYTTSAPFARATHRFSGKVFAGIPTENSSDSFLFNPFFFPHFSPFFSPLNAPIYLHGKPRNLIWGALPCLKTISKESSLPLLSSRPLWGREMRLPKRPNCLSY